MRLVTYEDERGRKYLVKLPEGMGDDEAELGIPVGPPDIVDALSLPDEIATRLHNELFNRKLFDLDTVTKNPRALSAALQAAYRLDVQTLHEAFFNHDKIPVNGGTNG